MNKTLFKASIFLLLLSLSSTLFSQVFINSTGAAPSSNAILDLNTGNSNNRGLIIPNVTLGSALTTFTPPIANAATSKDVGMVVYNNSATHQPIGYYYWNGTAWVAVGTGSGWSFTGNAGTPPGTNFIGTTDANALEFKVDGQKAGWIDYNGSNANTFFGYETGNINTGFANTGNGFAALNQNTTGFNNTANGAVALYINTTGSNNTATGVYTLMNNTIGVNNTATGADALNHNTFGSQNTAMGYIALFNNSSGLYNTAIGNAALASNTTGNNNVAVGASALYNSTGSYNTGYGTNALLADIGGSVNTAVGYQALQSNTTGTNNVAVGDNALAANVTGNDNTAIGSGANVSGSLTNTTAIGYDATATNSNSVEIGNSSVSFTGINGAAYNSSYALAIGSSTGNGNGAYLTTGGTWTNVSNRNLKENFTVPDGEEILTNIAALPVLRWNYKNEPSTIQHIGPMAQDFYRIFHVGNDSLSISTIDPAGIALIGVQELNKKLEAENAALKAQINELTQSVESQNQSLKEQQAKDEKEIAELKALIIPINQAQASIKQ